MNIKAIVVIISTFETLPATLYRLMYAIAPEPVYTLGSESNLWSKNAFHDMVKRMALLEHFGMADDIANMAIYLNQSQEIRTLDIADTLILHDHTYQPVYQCCVA